MDMEPDQVVLYSDAPPEPPIEDDAVHLQWRTDLATAKWGWRLDDEDTGIVFDSRDAAFEDAAAKHPEAAIG